MAEGRDFNVGQMIVRPLEAAVTLTKDALVLAIDASGDLILCDNTTTPYAIANRSTQDKVARTAGIVQYNNGAQTPGGVPVYRSGLAALPLGSTNIAIKIGDRIIVHADDDGTVNGGSAEASVADILLTVGFAEEVVSSNAGGTVLTALKLPFGGAP